MDAQVLAAMARWPGVPDVYGWLLLDARGRFRLRAGAAGAVFETIGNAALADFIARNYHADELGRWYFQNGPQRVFARLELTPWVYRLDGHAAPVAHTGRPAVRVDGLILDDFGTPILVTDLGPGAVDDRDLAVLLSCLTGADGQPLDDAGWEAWLASPADGGLKFAWQGTERPVSRLPRSELPRRFGYDPDPRPPARAAMA